jgi:hypothetical protein
MSDAALWHHAGFRRLFAASSSFSLATQVYQLALPLAFYELTRSASVMTAMRATELLPNLLLAMFIGVWVDRIDRGRWARRAITGMVALMGVQALLLPHGAAVLPVFFGCAFALMTLNYVYAICRMGLVKEMLPAPLLLAGTGQLSVIAQVAAVAGPALAGALVARRLELALWVPMAGLALAAMLLRGLDLPQRPPGAAGFWRDWREGWQVLRANRPLWQVSWIVVAMNGSAGVVEVLFLFRARDQLQLGPATLGTLYAVAALGGVAAGFACSRLRRRWGLGRLLATFVAVEGASFLALAWATAVPVLVAGLAVNSFATVIGNVCIWGFRQESTQAAHIGRISGLTGSIFKLAMPFTLLVAGGLASHQGLAIGPLLSACAGLHALAALALRGSAVYLVR